MNDDIERLNEQNRKLNEPSEGNFSRAAFSNISYPEKQDKKPSMAEGIIQDLGNQRQEIDSIKEMIKLLLDEQNGIKTALNQLTQAMNGTVQGTPQTKGLNVDTIAAIGDLAEKGVEVYKTLKGSPAQTSLIDQDFINKRMVESVMDDLETGKSITHFPLTILE